MDMLRKSVPSVAVFLGVFLALVLFVAGCSSSGGGSAEGEGAYGKVGVLLSETALDTQEASAALFKAPGDNDRDYEHIWITITKVELLPAGDEKTPVEIYSSGDGCEVDLVELEEGNLLFAVDQEVPAGTYEKVRVWVSGIVTDGGECDGEVIKVPSGKIDFNPQGGIKVEPAGTLYVKLKIDAGKSINLHQTGQGKCIFRPVVFAEILFAYLDLCPEIFEGTILELMHAGVDLLTDGFILERDCPCLPDLTVRFSEETLVFGEGGEPVDFTVLQEEQDVTVFGSMDLDRGLDALFIKIGDILVLDGTVLSVENDGDFMFLPDPGQVIGGAVTVDMSDPGNVLVQGPCGGEMGVFDILQGGDLRVMGLLDAGTKTMTPFAVLVMPGR